jgi:large subunit ribosomal protein L25
LSSLCLSQLCAIKGTLEHIDLILVRRGERVVVSVPVHAFGKYDQDGILEHVNNAVEVEVEATSIPAHLDLDMEGLAAGASLYASDVKLPEGVTLASDPKMIVVHLSVRVAVEEVVATPAAAEGGEAAAPADAGDATKS